MTFTISSLSFDSQVVLAPMEAVNCTAFRLICKKYGSAYSTTQMYDADKFIQSYETTSHLFYEHYIDFLDDERPLCVQFSANNAQKLKRCIEILDATAQYEMIDLNFGCPLSEQLAKKAGAYYMKHIDQMAKFVSSLTSYTNKPITAKIRLGWDKNNITFLDAGKVLENAGISAIAFHPRTREQRYMDKIKLEPIQQLVEHVCVPIIGNGDITMPGHAKAMLERTGCAAVMVGRGARGNPCIFSQINHLLKEGKNMQELPLAQDVFKEFVHLYETRQRRQSFSELQDHARWFCAGAPNAQTLRQGIDRCHNKHTLLGFLDKEWQ